MKKNKLTFAAIVAAAITLAPVATPSFSSFASVYTYNNNGDLTLSETDGIQSVIGGSLTANPNRDVVIFDKNGIATSDVIPAGINAKYTGAIRMNGELYYELTYNRYVLANDVIVVKGVGAVNDYVTVGANSVILYDELGSAITKNGIVQRQAAGSVLKATLKVDINGVQFYKVGDNQYLKVSDVTLGTGTMEEVDTTPEINAISGVVTINYVPGYGIQVWTQKLGFVKDEFGANKKLAHNTSWKVFAETTIDGKTYYNLGGDQWVDATYATLN